jgi:hypothetical protein
MFNFFGAFPDGSKEQGITLFSVAKYVRGKRALFMLY